MLRSSVIVTRQYGVVKGIEAGGKAGVKGGGVGGAGTMQVNRVGVVPSDAGQVVLNQHYLLLGG
jgi:hypothetical protein